MVRMPSDRACRTRENLWSPRRTSPWVGITRPERTLSSVDFPAPFSPARAWISPARNSRVRSFSARTPGKSQVRCCTAMKETWLKAFSSVVIIHRVSKRTDLRAKGPWIECDQVDYKNSCQCSVLSGQMKLRSGQLQPQGRVTRRGRQCDIGGSLTVANRQFVLNGPQDFG